MVMIPPQSKSHEQLKVYIVKGREMVHHNPRTKREMNSGIETSLSGVFQADLCGSLLA